MWKACTSLGHNETFCDDVGSEAYAAKKSEFQVITNNYLMVGSWFNDVPNVFFCLFVGALSDEIGRCETNNYK